MGFKFLKQIILTSVLFAGVSNGFSQSYYHSPNDTLIESTVLDGQVTMNITQVHPTNDTLHFHWNKLNVDMPIEWEANICDNSNCYTALENYGTTLPVLPGDDGLMLIHCTPHSVEGTAVIRYSIYEENTPSQVDTLTWIIHASFAGISSLSNNSNFIWSSGNSLHFEGNIENFNSVRIFDLTGKTIFTQSMKGESSLEIPTFNSAMVFIELSGDKAFYKQKIFLQ